MNRKLHDFTSNFSYTLISNLVSLLVSITIVLIVPRFIGVEDYGYWQLYLFYASYVGFLHFGWNDGIYLRSGGKEYNNLDKKKYFSQFYMLLFLQILMAAVIFGYSNLVLIDINRRFILEMISICLILTNTRGMILLMLQATNRIKEYARVTMIGRFLFIIVTIVLLILGVRDFKIIILSDLVGRTISLILAIYYFKDIVFIRATKLYFDFSETFLNIRIGIKLMIANVSSMLIIGVIRFGIERNWDIVAFGKVSLTLSISNLLMIFVQSISIILFPLLRRTEKANLLIIYSSIRNFLMPVLLGGLLFYYPIKVILISWLPNYSDSIVYMALVFPIIVFEAKMALLLNTYFKTLRYESLLLKINLVSVMISILLTVVNVMIIKNLYITVLSILLVLSFRSTFAELYMSKILKVSTKKDIILEILLTSIFVSTAWFISSWSSVLIYSSVYLVYLLIKKQDISNSISIIKKLVKE